MMPLIYIVAGARPNFMKIAPIVRALRLCRNIDYKIVHTGQHYDKNMNEVFFDELGIPKPDVCFNCGGGTYASQMGRIMVAFEDFCRSQRPDVVVVVGDVTSTLACALVAKISNIRVAHVEAGLRSGDMSMPEEIHRIAVDSISDWLFVTEPTALSNLQAEGKLASKIHHVGNVMVDNLLYQAEKLSLHTNTPARAATNRYGVVTLHRQSNVECKDTLKRICDALNVIAQEIPLFFPAHPRTRNSLQQMNIRLHQNIALMEPQGYMNFLQLWKNAVVVLTDSGGLQEETTALGIPCITLRDNTERPITVEAGSNVLAGTKTQTIISETFSVLSGRGKQGQRPMLWDGHAATRIVAVLTEALAQPALRTIPVNQTEEKYRPIRLAPPLTNQQLAT